MGKRKARGTLTADQAVTLMRLYQEGVPVGDLEQRFDIDRSTITRLRGELGVPARPRGGTSPAIASVMTPEALEEARRQLSRVEEVG